MQGELKYFPLLTYSQKICLHMKFRYLPNDEPKILESLFLLGLSDKKLNLLNNFPAFCFSTRCPRNMIKHNGNVVLVATYLQNVNCSFYFYSICNNAVVHCEKSEKLHLTVYT